jgi:RNA polymerase-binding transcription factor DksA
MTSTHSDSTAQAAQLRSLAQRLREEIRATLLRLDADRYGLLAGQVHDTKDQSVAMAVLETGAAEIERDARELDDVENALQRLHAGRYGHCVACDSVIPAERLRAYPTAKRCLPCQTRHEAQRRT